MAIKTIVILPETKLPKTRKFFAANNRPATVHLASVRRAPDTHAQPKSNLTAAAVPSPSGPKSNSPTHRRPRFFTLIWIAVKPRPNLLQHPTVLIHVRRRRVSIERIELLLRGLEHPDSACRWPSE